MGSCLTVILPVLNAMPYLPEALASLEAQTFRDFEVCLWDNGSTDASVEEAQRWIPGRLPGRVVTGRPLPLHQCLATMVEEAPTEFVARMDGDDISMPQRFELQLDFLSHNPAVALVGGQIECMDSSGEILAKEVWAEYPLTHSEIVSRMMILGPFNHPSILFRRQSILDVGNYKVPAPVEDHNLYLEIVQKHRVANLPHIVTHYRLHNSSICSNASKGDFHNQRALESNIFKSLDVWGIDPVAFRKMRGKIHPCCILPLWASARKRARREKMSAFSIARGAAFIHAGRCIAAKNDLISKLAFRNLDARCWNR
jgi:glycosyltransferase involved in cell wall biosynthesis